MGSHSRKAAPYSMVKHNEINIPPNDAKKSRRITFSQNCHILSERLELFHESYKSIVRYRTESFCAAL